MNFYILKSKKNSRFKGNVHRVFFNQGLNVTTFDRFCLRIFCNFFSHILFSRHLVLYVNGSALHKQKSLPFLFQGLRLKIPFSSMPIFSLHFQLCYFTLNRKQYFGILPIFQRKKYQLLTMRTNVNKSSSMPITGQFAKLQNSISSSMPNLK